MQWQLVESPKLTDCSGYLPLILYLGMHVTIKKEGCRHLTFVSRLYPQRAKTFSHPVSVSRGRVTSDIDSFQAFLSSCMNSANKVRKGGFR